MNNLKLHKLTGKWMESIMIILFVYHFCMIILTAVVFTIAESIYGISWQRWTTGMLFVILLLTPVIMMFRKDGQTLHKNTVRTCSTCVYGTFFKDVSRVGSGFCLSPTSFPHASIYSTNVCAKWEKFDKSKNRKLLRS